MLAAPDLRIFVSSGPVIVLGGADTFGKAFDFKTVAGCVSLRQGWPRACQFLTWMRRNGVEANEITYTSLLRLSREEAKGTSCTNGLH